MGNEFPSIIFETRNILFSIPSTNVQSIIKLPEVTPIPNSSANVRGVIRYRDFLYSLIDFRKALSMRSVNEEVLEFKNMIDQREKDHINWLDALCNSVLKNEKFTLTTNPHKCAFGKWYDNYKPENQVIAETIKKFDLPHKNIHSIADEIEKLKVDGNITQARKKIQSVKKNELKRMMLLFTNIKKQVQNEKHELAILFERDSKRYAITVDKINAVEEIIDVDTKNLDSELFQFSDKKFFKGLVQNKSEELVVAVSDEYLC